MRKPKTKPATAAPAAPPAPHDHNQPPEPFDTLGDAIDKAVDVDPFAVERKRIEECVEAANKWIEDVGTITTPEQAEKCSDFSLQLLRAEQALETALKAARKPHQDQVKALGVLAMVPQRMVEKARALLQPLSTAWLIAEKQRKDAEVERLRRQAEEQRERAENEAAKAAAGIRTVQSSVEAEQAEKQANQLERQAQRMAMAGPKVAGAYRPRAQSLRTVWEARVLDHRKALEFFADNWQVKELVLKLAEQHARTNKNTQPIPGVQITSREVASS